MMPNTSEVSYLNAQILTFLEENKIYPLAYEKYMKKKYWHNSLNIL